MLRIPLPPMLVFCDSDQWRTFPATPWGESVNFEMLREALEARNMPAGGAMTAAVGIQTCQTPDAPDAAVALAATRTSDGLTFPAAFVDKTATTGIKRSVRGVFMVKNTTALDTTLRFAWLAGWIESQKK